MDGLNIDETLLDCVIRATAEGMMMTGMEPSAIGASCFNNESRDLAILVGLHGARNGNMTMSMSARTAMIMASKLLGMDMEAMDDDTVDAVCEIGNMVAGRTKDILLETDYGFEAISLPALIFGGNYNFYHVKNIINVTVTFELPDVSMITMRDKFFSTSVAMMKV